MNQSFPSKREQRRDNIMNVLKLQGKISIHDIIQQFRCSEATARRDLDFLERSEGVIRTIGGAHFDGFLGSKEASFNEKRQSLWLEKESIAKKAASLVAEGDVVCLSGGTTTFLIAKEMKAKRHITVVTNAVNIAMELAESEGVQVVVTGGVMRSNSFELCGPLAQRTIEGLHINKMFIGIDGISFEHGITTYSELEAETAKLLIKHSKQTIAVFDHSKVGRVSLFSVAPLSSLHACITDIKVENELEKALEQFNVEIFLSI